MASPFCTAQIHNPNLAPPTLDPDVDLGPLATSNSHHYMSVSDVMSWLEEHLGSMTDRLEDGMKGGDARANELKDLGDLKGALRNNPDWSQWQKQADALAQKYPNDPSLQQVCAQAHGFAQQYIPYEE